MAQVYQAPGVYVEEIPKFPPSVAEVATAVPAFIGYTETGEELTPTRIANMVEYEQVFGHAHLTAFELDAQDQVSHSPHPVDGIDALRNKAIEALKKAKNAIEASASQAGGPTKKGLGDADKAVTAMLEQVEDAPAPAEALVELKTALHTAAKQGEQASKAVQDIDLPEQGQSPAEKSPEAARLAVEDAVKAINAANDSVKTAPPAPASSGLQSGPLPKYLLHYALRHYFDNGGGPCYIVKVGGYGKDEDKKPGDFVEGIKALEQTDEPTLIVLTDAANLGATEYANLCAEALKQCGEKLRDRFVIIDVPDDCDDAKKCTEFKEGLGTDYLSYGAAYYPFLQTTLPYHYELDNTKIADKDEQPKHLKDIAKSETARYQKAKQALAQQRVTLPPSAAIAGVYARVDRDRGVWKAPANVGLASVLGPSKRITEEQQKGFNVDPTSGKSINVIRAFSGRGTLVWGARTLAGNDNEWRYINVRRLFIMIEESARKATAFAVFEPNDASTWLKVKGMLEGFLYGLWQRGALAGPTPESAYYVHVGLNRTMSQQDILDGRMIVEIGIAAVRPAEFIVLRFSHKLQEG